MDNLKIEEVKKLRIEIHVLMNTLYILHSQNIKDFTQIYEKLQMARMWLGNMLKYMGDSSPYDVEKPVTKPSEIPPEVDLSDVYDTIQWNTVKDVIAGIYNHRDKIQVIIDKVEKIAIHTREGSICRTNAWSYLCESKMILGLCLKAIRELNSTNEEQTN
jgi:hypothetical protein